MHIKIYTLKVLVIIFFSCSKKTKTDIKIEDKKYKTEYNKLTTLKENLFLFGNVESFDMLDDYRFIVTTSKPGNIILFDKKGSQIKKIGSNGKGPIEYIDPSIVRVHNEKIFVWDSKQLKMLVFDKLGNPIREYPNFKVAIKDFKVVKNFVCFYFGGGFSGMIGVYDLIKEQFVFRGGGVSEEHMMLNVNKAAGGINLFREGLIYVSADKLSIKYINFSNFEEVEIVSINDNDFKVSEVDNSREIINSGLDKLMDYLMENSFVNGLFIVDNKIVIKTEVGEFNKTKKGILNNKNRFQKFYIINKDLDLVNVSKIKHDLDNKNNLYSAYKNKLYCIKYNTKNNKFNYELSSLFFKK